MASQHVKVATDATFEELVLKSATPVLVDFWATWCAPCKAIAPVLDKIADEKGGALTIVKVDVDSNQRTAMKYQVRSIPALLLFKNGEVIGQTLGAQPYAKLTEFVGTAL
jgi:thioredoxin 1